MSNYGSGQCRLRSAVRSTAFKYALAYVVQGACVLRFDNEAGKGDHLHLGDTEKPYRFTTPEQLLADFWKEVDAWKASTR